MAHGRLATIYWSPRVRTQGTLLSRIQFSRREWATQTPISDSRFRGHKPVGSRTGSRSRSPNWTHLHGPNFASFDIKKVLKLVCMHICNCAVCVAHPIHYRIVPLAANCCHNTRASLHRSSRMRVQDSNFMRDCVWQMVSPHSLLLP